MNQKERKLDTIWNMYDNYNEGFLDREQFKHFVNDYFKIIGFKSNTMDAFIDTAIYKIDPDNSDVISKQQAENFFFYIMNKDVDLFDLYQNRPQN